MSFRRQLCSPLLHALESPDPGISLEERNLGGHLPCLSLNKKHQMIYIWSNPHVELRPSKYSFDKIKMYKRVI